MKFLPLFSKTDPHNAYGTSSGALWLKAHFWNLCFEKISDVDQQPEDWNTSRAAGSCCKWHCYTDARSPMHKVCHLYSLPDSKRWTGAKPRAIRLLLSVYSHLDGEVRKYIPITWWGLSRLQVARAFPMLWRSPSHHFTAQRCTTPIKHHHLATSLPQPLELNRGCKSI